MMRSILIVLLVLVLQGCADSVKEEVSITSIEEGVDKMQNGAFPEAYQILKETSYKAEKLDSVRLSILAYNNLGNLFYYLNNKDSAIFYYERARRVADSNQYQDLKNTLLNNLGVIYSNAGDYKNSLDCFSKALALNMLQKDSVKLAINLTNIGRIRVLLKEYTVAHSSLQQAEDIFTRHTDSIGLTDVYFNYGLLNYAKGHYEAALASFQKSARYVNFDVLPLEGAKNYLEQGKCLVAIGSGLEAIDEFTAAKNLAVFGGDQELEAEVLDWMSIGMALSNEPEQSVDFAKQSLQLRQEIDKVEEQERVARQMAEMDVFQREMLRDAEGRAFQIRKKNGSLVIITVFLGLLVVILLLRNRWLRERKKKISLKYEKQSLVKEKELVEKEKLDLSEELSNVKQQLVSASTILHNKSEIIGAIDQLVKEIEANPGETAEFNHEHIRSLKSKIVQAKQTDQSWEDFKVHFEGLHHNFFRELLRKHPDLNANELRLAAYLFMQLSAKEISQLLNIQTDTVRKRKQRLKEKIGLQGDQNLSIYLFNLLQ